MSLKITWLRTIDKKPRMDSISSNIDRLATTDIDYHMKLYKNTHNPSWGKRNISLQKLVHYIDRKYPSMSLYFQKDNIH